MTGKAENDLNSQTAYVGNSEGEIKESDLWVVVGI